MGNRSHASGNNFGPWIGGHHMVQNRTEFGMGNNTKAFSIWGFDQIIKNLSAIIVEKGLASKKGLLEVAKMIRRDMEENQPFVPKDKGNLDPSWTVVPLQEGKQFGIMMGFSANYALWVHEMLGEVKWKKPGSGPKFLESAINRNHDTIFQILQDNLKIK